jgi:rRNA maturation endonuclease Nob1
MSNTHTCYECGAEFAVEPEFDIDDAVSFCPYCGNELEGALNDEDELEDEDYRD